MLPSTGLRDPLRIQRHSTEDARWAFHIAEENARHLPSGETNGCSSRSCRCLPHADEAAEPPRVGELDVADRTITEPCKYGCTEVAPASATMGHRPAQGGLVRAARINKSDFCKTSARNRGG